LINSGVFYGFNNDESTNSRNTNVVTCRNGSAMTLYNCPRDGLMWRCPKRQCCNRSRKSIRRDSFFSGRKASIEDIILVLYFFITGATMSQIVGMTELHHTTVQTIVQDIYSLLEADLRKSDMEIGKFKFNHSFFFLWFL